MNNTLIIMNNSFKIFRQLCWHSQDPFEVKAKCVKLNNINKTMIIKIWQTIHNIWAYLSQYALNNLVLWTWSKCQEEEKVDKTVFIKLYWNVII